MASATLLGRSDGNICIIPSSTILIFRLCLTNSEMMVSGLVPAASINAYFLGMLQDSGPILSVLASPDGAEAAPEPTLAGTPVVKEVEGLRKSSLPQ